MTPHEIEIRATNAKGETATVHAEFHGNGSAPADAAKEILGAAAKEFGTARVKEVDPAR